jgi:hypothetical protein
LCLGIGASSCSGSLEFFCATGWAAESTDAWRPKSDLGTDFCQRCGGPKRLIVRKSRWWAWYGVTDDGCDTVLQISCCGLHRFTGVRNGALFVIISLESLTRLSIYYLQTPYIVIQEFLNQGSFLIKGVNSRIMLARHCHPRTEACWAHHLQVYCYKSCFFALTLKIPNSVQGRML